MDIQSIYLLIIIFIIVFFCLFNNKKQENFKLSDDLICGVTDDNQLWCAWENIYSNPKWYKIKGDVKYISLTDKNDLYGLDEVGNLYYRNDYEQDYKNPINWNIPNVPGQPLKTFKQLSSDKEMTCGADTDGTIHCYDKSNLIDPSWIAIESPDEKEFKSVIVKDNKLYAITEDNEIYNKERYNNEKWQLLSNSLTQISVDKNVVCGTDEAKEIHCYDNDKILNPNWVKIEGKTLDSVIVRDGTLIGVDSNKEIFMNKNYKDEKPVWIKIPGNGFKQIDIKKSNKWF
jgi:hypothetical protein